MMRLRHGVAAQHQATAFQEASRTARREVVQQAMVQGAPPAPATPAARCSTGDRFMAC
jgi:hypothetical protein